MSTNADDTNKNAGGNSNANPSPPEDPRLFWISLLQYVLIFIVTIIFVMVLWFGLRDLTELGKPEVARGLITFVIAVTTIAIALLLTLTAIVTKEPDKRFALGKEILTILVGVLGTIIGFYFGTTMEARKYTEDQVTFSVPVSVSPEPVPRDPAQASVDFHLSGGRPPYFYSIIFSPASIATVKAKSDNGVVNHGFTVPQSATELVIRVEGKDSKGNAFSYNRDGRIKTPLQ